LRDRVARRLASIDKGSRLEGCDQGSTRSALRRWPIALERKMPGDARSIHAVAHAMEMTDRVENGREWLAARSEDWSPDNSFALHNCRHLALCYLDPQRRDGVLEIYDTRVRGSDSWTGSRRARCCGGSRCTTSTSATAGKRIADVREPPPRRWLVLVQRPPGDAGVHRRRS